MKCLALLIIFLTLSHPTLAIDINTATAQEMAHELSGIGPVKAQRIVEYREKIGGFISMEQLMEIKGIGAKTLERNRDRIQISSPPTKSATDARSAQPQSASNKPTDQAHNMLWDALVIIPFFIACLFIFAVAWLKSRIKDKPVPRKHLVSTTFVCSECGKVTEFKNVRYEGYLSHQYIDGDLPPGWSCIPNYLGQLCDYCFDCSQKVHANNLG